MPGTSPSSRIVALDLIAFVLKRRRALDEALEGHAGFAALEARERAFARNLSATTLRRLGQIDDLVAHCLERPLPRRAIAVRDVLRLGICQLFFLNTPAHAAVDTTVSLLDGIEMTAYKKLVNAIMRRLTREGKTLLAAQDPARLNTPDWLWESWHQAYGEDICRQIATAHLREPPLDITPASEPGVWAEALEATVLPTGSLRLVNGGNVTGLAGFDEGVWWVQDVAAALPVALLGNVQDKQVIDLCAAPGGKTAQLISRGARVTSIERSANRLKRLQRNLDRLNMTAETVCADAARWKPAELADAVLLDAPCSATGTIRRHPDIPLLKKPEDVENLSAAQWRLFEAALGMVKQGGLLVFCTCSLQPQEGPDLVVRMLAAHPPLHRLPVKAEEVGGLSELITGEGELRCLPSHLSALGGMDGFYAARFVCD